MSSRRKVSRDPFTLALLIQTMIIPLALGLALLAGVTPWDDLRLSPLTLVTAVGGTAPVLLALALLERAGAAWFRQLEAIVRPALEALFRGRGAGAIALVALLAGVSEELLFRGVLQAWLATFIDPWLAVAAAAIVFGSLHHLSRAYFLYATALGLYLGAIYEITGDLLAVCLIHALYDWAAIRHVLTMGSRVNDA